MKHTYVVCEFYNTETKRTVFHTLQEAEDFIADCQALGIDAELQLDDVSTLQKED